MVAVDVLNLGTIIGLPIGIAAYFWANRLLPVTIGDWVFAGFDLSALATGVFFAFVAHKATGKPACWDCSPAVPGPVPSMSRRVHGLCLALGPATHELQGMDR